MSEQTVSGPRHVTARDQVPIAYWTSGSGPPLLLVHGAMSDHRRWRITPYLAPHRSVHLMDRRGRCGSGDGVDWSLDLEVDDVVAVVDSLAAEHGEPVDVLGHSLGGLLTLRAAARTAHVSRLLLYEPAVHEQAQPPELVAGMQDLLDRGEPDEAVALMMREVVRMPEHEIAAVRALPSWPTRVEAAPTLPRELSTPLVWGAEEADAVRVPTLVLLGGDSPAEVQASARSLVAALPDATLQVIEGQQHVADQFVPELFAELVLDFLLS